MYRRVLTIITPFALVGLTACGAFEADMSVDDAVYMSALEEEDLGTGEGDDPADGEDAADAEGAADADADAATGDGTVAEVDDCSLEAIRARITDRFDTNGNGNVDPDEQANMSGHFGGDHHGHMHGHKRGKRGRGHHRGLGHHKLHRIKWIYDTDNSGELSETERAVLEGDLVTRCENKEAYMLATYDTDADGVLSEEELAAASAAKEAEREARRAERLAEIDTDGDGEVSKTERRAARDARRANCEARRAAKVEMFDADGDGELNDEETNALRDYLRQWVRGEHIGGDRPFE
jgi:Ca2+-binding EF-hand superfamily protein